MNKYLKRLHSYLTQTCGFEKSTVDVLLSDNYKNHFGRNSVIDLIINNGNNKADFKFALENMFVLMNGDWRNENYVRDFFDFYVNLAKIIPSSLYVHLTLKISANKDAKSLRQDFSELLNFLHKNQENNKFFSFYAKNLYLHFYRYVDDNKIENRLNKEFAYFINMLEKQDVDFVHHFLYEMYGVNKKNPINSWHKLVDVFSITLKDWKIYEWLFHQPNIHKLNHFMLFYVDFLERIYEKKVKNNEKREKDVIRAFVGHHYLIWKNNPALATKLKTVFFKHFQSQKDMVSNYFENMMAKADVEEKINFKNYVAFLMEDAHPLDKAYLIQYFSFNCFIQFGKYFPKFDILPKKEIEIKNTHYHVYYSESDYNNTMTKYIDTNEIFSDVLYEALSSSDMDNQVFSHFKDFQKKTHLNKFLKELLVDLFYSIIDYASKDPAYQKENKKRFFEKYVLLKNIIKINKSPQFDKRVQLILVELANSEYKKFSQKVEQYHISKSAFESIVEKTFILLTKMFAKWDIPIPPIFAFFFQKNIHATRLLKHTPIHVKCEINKHISFKQQEFLKKKFKNKEDWIINVKIK